MEKTSGQKVVAENVENSLMPVETGKIGIGTRQESVEGQALNRAGERRRALSPQREAEPDQSARQSRQASASAAVSVRQTSVRSTGGVSLRDSLELVGRLIEQLDSAAQLAEQLRSIPAETRQTLIARINAHNREFIALIASGAGAEAVRGGQIAPNIPPVNALASLQEGGVFDRLPFDQAGEAVISENLVEIYDRAAARLEDFESRLASRLEQHADGVDLQILDREAAQLLALQARQQLSQTGPSLTNDRTEEVLAYFR